MLEQYTQWLSQSEAVFMIEYSRLNMKDIDGFRAKVREAGGSVHVVKNTLMELALKEVGAAIDKPLIGTTLMGFATSDVPALAKVFSDATKAEHYELKGGFLNKRQISAANVKALADMPPLPVMRAKVLGMLLAPASQLVRTLAEPARSLAAVVKAHSEKEATPVAG
jgi:large subunit ribosomal protein L10